MKYPLILFKFDYTSHAVFVIFCFSHFWILSHSQRGCRFNSRAGNEKKHPFRPGYLVHLVFHYLVCAEVKPEMEGGVIAENILDSFSYSLFCFPPCIYSYQTCEDISYHPATSTYNHVAFNKFFFMRMAFLNSVVLHLFSAVLHLVCEQFKNRGLNMTWFLTSLLIFLPKPNITNFFCYSKMFILQEVQNGRLFRLLAKLGTINERPE